MQLTNGTAAMLGTAALVFTSCAVSLMWNSAFNAIRHSPRDPDNLPDLEPVDITETFVDRSTAAGLHIAPEPMAGIHIDAANLFHGWPQSVENDPAPIDRRRDGVMKR